MLVRQVLVLAPNLIGYFRLCLLVLGIAFSSLNPVLSFWLFLLNFVLDGVDGMLARRWNQVRRFEQIFEMFVLDHHVISSVLDAAEVVRVFCGLNVPNWSPILGLKVGSYLC